MRNTLVLVLASALLLGCGDQSGAPLAPGAARLEAAATTTENVITPIEIVAFVPCANGGLGEHVRLSGTLHSVFHVTEDGAGGSHVVAITQAQVSGVGLESGDTYHGTEIRQNETTAQAGFEHTFTNSFLLIGPGPDNNYLFHWTLHFTETPDGTLTAFADSFHLECR